MNDNWLHHDIMQVRKEELYVVYILGRYIIALCNVVKEYLIEVWLEISHSGWWSTTMSSV